MEPIAIAPRMNQVSDEELFAMVIAHPASAQAAPPIAAVAKAFRTRALGMIRLSQTFTLLNCTALANRSSFAGQMSRGGVSPNKRWYDSNVRVYQSSNLAPSAWPPRVGSWWRGRCSTSRHRRSQYDLVYTMCRCHD